MRCILLLLVILLGLTGCSQEPPVPTYYATQPEYWTAQGYEITDIMSSAGEVIFVTVCKSLDESSHRGYDACIIINYEDQRIGACIGSADSCYDPATDMSSEYNDFFGSVTTPWPSHVEYNDKSFVYTFIEA